MDYLHIPIDDFSIPSIEQVDHFIKAVKEFRAKTAKAVGVHCLGGWFVNGQLRMITWPESR